MFLHCKLKSIWLKVNLDRDLEDEVTPWWESHVHVPGVEEVLEQLEELLLPGDVRGKHHRADKVRKLRELGVSEVPGEEVGIKAR